VLDARVVVLMRRDPRALLDARVMLDFEQLHLMLDQTRGSFDPRREGHQLHRREGRLVADARLV